MKNSNLELYIITCLLFFISCPVKAQTNISSSDSIRSKAISIFIDCRCDIDHIRREIPYVNYVRDVKLADVYIHETSQSSASGGSMYTYTFQGQNKYRGMSDTLTYSRNPDETKDQTRAGRTQMIELGLVRYVAKSDLKSYIQVNHNGKIEEEEVRDMWNSWVFDFEVSASIEGEESYKEKSIWSSVGMSQITEDWKFEFEFDYDIEYRTYSYDDTIFTKIKSFKSSDNLIVKSLGSHWSAGIAFKLGSSSYRNKDLYIDFSPVIEYSIYPYNESTYRRFILKYGLGYTFNDYNQTTIYDKDIDNLIRQEFEISFWTQQKWGSINMSFEASNYMDDFSKNRLELNGRLRLRIIKGLSVSLNGYIARIHDQISLPKGGLSEADRLLRLQQIATNYSYGGRIGLSYTFGSIYNNIVNPRISRRRH